MSLYSHYCTDHIFNVDDGTVSVRNVDVDPNGKYQQICGYAEGDPAYPGEGGALIVHFPLSPVGNYWLLDTDYKNYASVYSCVSFLNIIKIEFAWVLVRDLNISTDLIDKAKSAFTNNKLDVSLFEIVEHKDCVYDPPDVPSCN